MDCVRCGSEIKDFAFCPYCGKRQPQTPPAAKPKRKKRPNGTGTVVKLKQNLKRPWRASMRGVVIGYYATEKEAYDALARLVDTDINDKYNWTFSQVYEAWKASRMTELSAGNREAFERAYALSEPLHQRKFRVLRSSDFQAVLDGLASLSESTLQKYRRLYTQMSDWAIANDIIQKNYATFTDTSGYQSVHHEPFSDDDIAKLEQDGSETSRVVLMLLATGMRVGELFALPLADYHGNYVVGGEKTEAGRDRIIPIRSEGREHFAYFAAKAKEKGSTLLIEGYEGHHDVRGFRRYDYYHMIDRLGIDRSKTPHSARVSYATRAATDDNLAPAVLQKVMGHKDFNTTQKFYNKPSPESLINAVESSVKNRSEKNGD